MRIKHEVSKYSCNECKYTASTTGYFKRHIEKNHEGVRYPCPDES